MVAAGALEQRVRFERRATADDGFGNVEATWIPLFTCWASLRPQSGREQMAAGRLESTLRGTLRVRRGADARGLRASDRVVFVAGRFVGIVCNITATPFASADGSSIEMAIEEGVGT